MYDYRILYELKHIQKFIKNYLFKGGRTVCFYLSSEVVLANLLVHREKQDGVSMQDIVQYCDLLKEELKKVRGSDLDYLYFNINPDSVDLAVDRYASEFRKLNDKIYKNDEINVNYFNYRYKPELINVLKNTALILGYKVVI